MFRKYIKKIVRQYIAEIRQEELAAAKEKAANEAADARETQAKARVGSSKVWPTRGPDGYYYGGALDFQGANWETVVLHMEQDEKDRKYWASLSPEERRKAENRMSAYLGG